MTAPQETLQDGFARFVHAAEELEASYASLRRRAASVDVELQETNAKLEQALAERDGMFAALPIGLVALRGESGEVAASNVEADRLVAAAAAVGEDLLTRTDGTVVFDRFVVRVRRVALPAGPLLMLEDRSHVESLEREVRRLDRLAGLSELALGVAHEIKNALNGVMGFAGLLERSDDPATMRRYAGKVVEGVRAVDEIVKGLLGFARPDAQAGRAEPLSAVVERVAGAARLARSRWQLRGAVDAPVDADAVGRVLSNLMRNALEARATARVCVTATLQRGELELLVEDDGPGVPAAVAGAVFEPFVSTKQRGTGLGLALSARVLSFLGGHLELLNPGQPGARFRVRVPAIGAAAAAAAAPPAAAADAAEVPA
ncbi:MAG: ATP-binding protein [Planctomycetota bacterium]